MKTWILIIVSVVALGPIVLKDEYAEPIKEIQNKSIGFAKGMAQSISQTIKEGSK